MLNRLYVFAIGGSGERVLKSLALLLAAGTKIEANEVIPVIVDNDENNAALLQCKKILTLYGNTEGDNGVHTIYEKAFGDDQNAWPSFCHTHLRKPIILNVAGSSIGNLKSIIGCPSKSDLKEDKDDNERIRSIEIERDLLFTEDDLEMPLNVGFVGNPNIGAVVLNSLSLSATEFQSIKNGIHSNDGVIVIGSLYGGTGAAGFPLIVNTFNQSDEKPVLGGIAVLPYFSTDKARVVDSQRQIDRKRWDVNSETFGTKTRAALMYYDDYMQGVDYLYYAGDDKPRVYPHSVGGPDQDNPYNLIELLSAICVIDFAKQSKHQSTTYKRPIWGFSDKTANVSNVAGIMNPEVRRAMVKFQMLNIVLKGNDFLKFAYDTAKQPFVRDIHFTEEVLQSILTKGDIKHTQATGLNGLLKEWDFWMEQLADNDAIRTLKIYNKETTTTRDNFTQNFYSESDGFGIARTKQETKGGFFGLYGKQVTVAQNPEILDIMRQVYDKLPESMKRNVSENQVVAYELLILSKALDRVIDEKCSI